MRSFRFVDLFCGGGGSITGEIAALKKAGIAYEGRGFNHWNLAIKTIQANHPAFQLFSKRRHSVYPSKKPEGGVSCIEIK